MVESVRGLDGAGLESLVSQRPNQSGLGKTPTPHGQPTRTEADAGDSVSLSSRIPHPLPASLLSEAIETGETAYRSGTISARQAERMREDRIFSAVAALAALGMGGNPSSLPNIWPGGLPVPTAAELQEAQRRLSQRLTLREAIPGQEWLEFVRQEINQRVKDYSFDDEHPLMAS